MCLDVNLWMKSRRYLALIVLNVVMLLLLWRNSDVPTYQGEEFVLKVSVAVKLDLDSYIDDVIISDNYGTDTSKMIKEAGDIINNGSFQF